ncbi:MAG: alpha-amylase family protein [Candidatus Omnitrophota bacterium]
MRRLRQAGFWYLAVPLILIGFFVLSGFTAEESVFGKLSFTYETPHIPWAKPYAGKKLRILVIAPVGTQRESVELWQRLECEIIPLMTAGFEKFTISREESYGPGFMEEAEVLNLSEKALSADWDVAVVGRVAWEALPPEVRLKILINVRDRGTGLVVIDQELELVQSSRPLSRELAEILLKKTLEDKEGFFNYVLPEQDLPVFHSLTLSKPFLRMAKFGKGRIIDLEYRQKGTFFENESSQSLTPVYLLQPNGRSESPYPTGSPVYDYYLSLVIRSILWAGCAEGDTRFRWFALPQVEIERARLQKEETLFNPWPTGADRQHWWIREKAKVRFWVEGNVKPPTALEWIIRNPYNEIEGKGRIEEIKIEPLLGGTIELPILPGGRHYLEVWLKREGKVVDWAIIPFNVKAECEPPSITLDKVSFDRGEEVKGKVLLAGELLPETQLSVKVWDNLGRLLVKDVRKEKGTVQPFSLRIPDPVTQSYIIKTIIEDKKGVISEDRAEFLMPLRGNDDYQFHAWAQVKDTPVNHYRLKKLQELGVDGIFFGALWTVPDILSQQAWVLSRLNLRVLPYMSSYCGWGLSPGEKDKTGNPLCPGKCLFAPDFAQGLFSRIQEQVSLLAPFAPLSYCLSEEDGLDFNKTDRCFCPASLKDFQGFLKKSYGDIASLNQSWGTDYKDFSECTPITFKEAKEKGQYPRWIDHRLHMTEGWTDFHIEMARATRQSDPRTIPVFFGSNLEPYFGNDPYRLNSVAGSIPGNPWEGGGVSDIPEVASFSPPGFYLAPVYGTYPPSYFEDNMRLQPWLSLAWGCNGNEWWVAYDGNLCQGNMMALTPSLEEPEVHFGETMEEVREIKRGIGKLLLNSKRRDDGIRILYSYSSMLVSEFNHPETTWADARSDLIKILGDSGLNYRLLSPEQVCRGDLKNSARVLFLSYSQAISPEEAKAILNFARAGGIIIADFSPGIMDEHGKTLPASSLSELFPEKKDLHHQVVGKGRGVYLGNLLRGYLQVRRSEQGNQKKAALLGILKEVGVTPKYALSQSDGNPVSVVSGTVFEDGEASYLLLLREERGKPPLEVKINLDRSAEIYDVREGKYIGGKGEAKIPLACCRAKLLSFLPYRVKSIDVVAQEPSGRNIPISAELKTESGKPGRHLFRLTVIGPDGKEIPYLARNIPAPGGKYEGLFHFALNDPAGKYLLQFKDVATGLYGQTAVLIK